MIVTSYGANALTHQCLAEVLLDGFYIIYSCFCEWKGPAWYHVIVPNNVQENLVKF